jgi:hypothetical protein
VAKQKADAANRQRVHATPCFCCIPHHILHAAHLSSHATALLVTAVARRLQSWCCRSSPHRLIANPSPGISRANGKQSASVTTVLLVHTAQSRPAATVTRSHALDELPDRGMSPGLGCLR